MADKRISQLVDRGTVVNSDVVPIVVSGAVTTNKATISSIQTFMQGNLDLGVTSVGITLGSSGTDVNVSGSPVTSSGNITINIPSASATNRGLVTTGAQTIAGAKTFNSDLIVNGITVGKGGASNVNNTAVGTGALSANTTGSSNTATGLSALLVNTGGNSNTANGYLSLQANTTGGSNASVGNQSLYSNTTGSNNTAVGNDSLYSNITGGKNTGIGAAAGYYIADGSTPNTTSDFSVYLGADTKASADNAQNETVIGYNAIGNGSNSVTIGNSSVTQNYFTGNVRGLSFQVEAAGTANPIIIRNTSGTSSTTSNTNVLGFNSVNNIFVTTHSRGGFILGFNNSVSNREYNLQDASGTLAFTSDISTALAAYVTLATTQTITAQKTFTTSGGTDSVIISTTGAGFALDAIKAGNGEVIRVNKTSGTGNAMTVIGGNFEAPTIVKTGGTSSQFLKADGSVDSSTYLTTGTAASTYLPLAGGTLTGALNGTSGAFTGAVSGSAVTITATTGIAGDFTNNSTTNEALRARNNGSGNIAAFRNASAEVASITNSGGLTLSGALNGTSASFSGLITSTIGNNSTILNSASATTGWVQIAMNNTTGSTLLGIEGSTAGTLATGTNAYASVLRNYTATDFQIATNNNVRLTIASTGAATFSSSVSSSQFIANGNSAGGFEGLRIINASTGAAQIVLNNSAQSWLINTRTDNQFSIFNATAATTPFLISTAGNVGIATDNPVLENGGGQVIFNSTVPRLAFRNSTSGTTSLDGTDLALVSSDFYVFNREAGSVIFGTGGTTKMTITSGGNVQIDDSGSSSKLAVKGGNATYPASSSASYTLSLNDPTSAAANVGGSIIFQGFKTSNTSTGNFAGIVGKKQNGTSGDESGFLGFLTSNSAGTFSEKMRITSAGEVGIGTNNPFNLASSLVAIVGNGSTYNFLNIQDTQNANNAAFIQFINAGDVGIGGITRVAQTNAVNYSTTSDYRLKEDLQEIKGLEVLSAIKVYNYKWKDHESRMDGVLAHELAEVLPYAVHGEKDEVDEKGNDKMQGVDYGKIVPVLIKAIQELKLEIDSLKNQIK